MSGQTRGQSCNIAGGKAGVEGESGEHSDVGLSGDPVKGLSSFYRATKLTQRFLKKTCSTQVPLAVASPGLGVHIPLALQTMPCLFSELLLSHLV